MLVIKEISKIRSRLKDEKKSDKKIAFVPTMGALHDGHLALIKKAQESAEVVVVSIFINKTQFNDPNDYKNYPRQIDKDLEKLKNCQVDYVFLPEDGEMFDQYFSHKIIPTQLTDCLCGQKRLGHFEGVALIITKLFNIIDPDIAIFGQKDFQQLAIIKKLVSDLNFDVEIYGLETLRESSGLAMSSRNQRLSESDKVKAAEIFFALNEIKNEVIKSPQNLEKILQSHNKKLLESGFEKIDYLEIRQEKDLQLVTNFYRCEPSRIFIAAYLNGIRLIDNLQLT
ncbi:MAG: pantoate--beta-alanine ligase [Proteobacteria bacterium]|nr:pantoate--beta-alanine ligase [Pseudomonadota bacterium]